MSWGTLPSSKLGNSIGLSKAMCCGSHAVHDVLLSNSQTNRVLGVFPLGSFRLWSWCHDDAHRCKQKDTDTQPEGDGIATQDVIQPACSQRSQCGTEGNGYPLHRRNRSIGTATKLISHNRGTQWGDGTIGSTIERDVDD